MTDRHEKREIKVFEAFAKVCLLPIKLNSIKKMSPPVPDIECRVSENKFLSFELVEIIDQNFASIIGKKIETHKSISEYHSKLSNKEKEHFDRIYSNALIFFRFKSGCTLRQRKKLFPVIFDHLLKLDEKFEGKTLENTCEYKNKLRGLRISRGRFNGPLFDSNAAGAFGDPAVNALNSKFQKTYKSVHPMHLLGYIDLNPMVQEDVWLHSVENFVKASMQNSQFEKVWVFDFQTNEIKFRFP